MDENSSHDPAPNEITLTPRQMDCMRLVKNGLTSKQIARELGISPRTVDQHIGTVIEILQVNNRMAAVTRLQQIELENRQGQDITTPKQFVTEIEPERRPDRIAAVSSPGIEPERVGPGRTSTFPALGGRTNTASRSQRLRWMIRIAILSVMLSCFIVLTIMGVSELASRGTP
ncbi:MAG: hypothetical protein CL575_10590 [Altererythrobacter sp.]|nr:hypothetical protein [Altererythrobacter sp.]|tara:strand:- start:802 stop:1320 length:519 start_codon:yes stop_codon:yes gene_type:complete